jgi:hypothetical protein
MRKKKRGELLIIITTILALSVILVGFDDARAADDYLVSSIINLPQTGQTACWDEFGALIDCENTGQDGEIQSGVNWPKPRFRVGTGDEADCVTDNLTGLMWARDGNLFDIVPVEGQETTWEEAMELVKDLTLCGYDDWALPNVNELASLSNDNSEIGFPLTNWYNSEGFTDMIFCAYGTSTTLASTPDTVFAMASPVGAIHAGIRKDGTNRDHVHKDLGVRGFCILPVRGGKDSLSKGKMIKGEGFAAFAAPVDLPKTGQVISYAPNDDGALKRGVKWPHPRFMAGTGDASDCVKDNLTGLMWTKDGDRFDTWQGALDEADALDLCGYTDWRIPNRKELRSLVNYGEVDNAAWLNTNGFSNVQAAYYWTSTTYNLTLNEVWLVPMNEGTVIVDERMPSAVPDSTKTGSFNFLPVRGGQGGALILPKIAPTSTPSSL